MEAGVRAVDRNRVEEEIRSLCMRGELGLAVEQTVRCYGPDIRRLLGAVLHDRSRAEDAFGLFCEHLVKGLPRFRWESSLRTWLQRIARNACFTLVDAAAVRHRHVGLSSVPELPAARRSSTNPWQRSTTKERLRALWDKREPQERQLLELHVDQQLPWPEVVRRMTASGESMTSEERTRRAAAVRQQFQRVKTRLRVLAMQEGLIPHDQTGP